MSVSQEEQNMPNQQPHDIQIYKRYAALFFSAAAINHLQNTRGSGVPGIGMLAAPLAVASAYYAVTDELPSGTFAGAVLATASFVGGKYTSNRMFNI